ncbi:MAG: hypothetical protein MRZ79_20215 [Bacteroidia bacterium]|nr:hypothetical protein [Bacteroidia bacterium]
MEEAQKKKSWIRTLAEQSWEAELIVSGVAIFGALSLPEQLENLMDWMFVYLPDQLLTYGALLVLYLYFGIQVLIAGFLIHFGLRVTWIGFVGLLSVYPDGFTRVPMYSDDFNEKLKKDFPSLETYVQKLDDAASLVFASTNTAILSLFSFCFTGTIFILIAFLINSFFPQLSIRLILIVFFSVIMIPSILSSVLHIKFLRDHEIVKKIHYPLYLIFSKVVLNVAFRPLNYLILTFYSHVKIQNFIFTFLIVSFLLGLFGGGRLANSSLAHFRQEDYFEKSRKPNNASPNFYGDEKDQDQIVLNAILPSQKVEYPYLEVFLPRLQRERKAWKASCGTYEEDSSLSDEENTTARQAFKLECLRNFQEFYIDDSLVQVIDISYTRKLEPYQRGISFTIDLEKLAKGPHTLKIKKQYFLENGEAKTIIIPFLYVPQSINR